MIRIMVIGSDSRTHAIVWKLAQSPVLDGGVIYVVPGNAGIARIPGVELRQDLTLTDCAPYELKEMARFARRNVVDLVIFCEERPLIQGCADMLRDYGILVFGPSQKAAYSLEGSKRSSKELFSHGSIPTAAYAEFTEPDKAITYLKSLSPSKYPLYVKAYGPVPDRSIGVQRCGTIFEAKRAVEQLLRDEPIRQIARGVIIEEEIEGPEISAHALVDRIGCVDHWPLSQDHKHLFPPGSVPPHQNCFTGGMGAIVPVPWLSEVETTKIQCTFVNGMIHMLHKRGPNFEGCLYPGIKGDKALEYNVRFGSPECQAYMRILENDLLLSLLYTANGRLREYRTRWSKQFAACVMLASEGYGFSRTLTTGVPITGIEDAEKIPGVVVFHGGTRIWDGTCFTGEVGRPLAVTAVGKTLREALARAYEGVGRIHFEGMQFRADIG